MKTERELFEEWAKERGLTRTRCEDTGVYFNQKTLYAWEAWQARVPEGYVVVPVDPTERMLDSAYSSISDNLHYADLENIYKAMLEAVEK